MITLRPYQEKILHELRVALKTHRSALVCAPPGAGKGSLIAFMVHSAVARGKRVIFVVRGRALITDMDERVTRLGVEHGVLMGGRSRETWHPVQVASIDTLHRMNPMPPADLLILDEARQFHNATGRKVLENYPAATKIVGADGTPALIDGSGLGDIFETMITGPNEQELIDLGFLVPSIPIGILDPPDVSKVGKTGGDFNQKKLAQVCDKAKLVGDIVQHWLKYANGLKTVAFGVDQAHARHITEEFRKAGLEWEYVDASTPDTERARIWERLDNGTLMGFSNCMIAGCGFDHAIIQCVIAARPTASLSLWRQMIGRASRPYPGKKHWILLDFAGNINRLFPHSFFETPPVWTLDGARRQVSDDETAVSVAMCKTPVRVPASGVPAGFTGPLSPDGRFMLPSYHCFRSGPEVCPYCGLPLPRRERKVETQAGELKDLSALREAAKKEAKKSPSALAYENKLKTRYLELARIAARSTRRDGTPYSPAWAAMQLRAEFNRWPLKAWKQEAAGVLA